MEINEAIKKLEKMKGRAWTYKNKVVEILAFADGVGENGDEIEIYLNDGTTIECLMINLPRKIKEFGDVSGTVVTMAHHKLDKVSSMNPVTMLELRDTVMETMRALKSDPSKINQAKQVFQGVNTMINLARTELEFRKYIDESVSKRNSR